MDLSKKYASAEQESVWREVDGMKFKLLSRGSRSAALRVQRFLTVEESQVLYGAKEEDVTKVFGETMLERSARIAFCHVLDWSDVDEHGESVPYSKDNLIYIFTTYPEVMGAVFKELNAVDAEYAAKIAKDNEVKKK